jgi:hypothetical protein
VEPPVEDVVIRSLVESDAPALAQCFKRCYGKSYVVAEFYDPAATVERIHAGTLRSMVAVSTSGEIVGHMGLTVRDPRAQTVDAGNSIVDPRYRGRQLVAHLALAVIELCRESGFLGFHHYPTTVHPIKQKLALAGGTETGIMLGYIPSGTEYREIEGAPRTDRPAVVVVYHPLREAPEREVFVAGEIAGIVRAMYERAALVRTVRTDAATLPAGATELRLFHDERRGLARAQVTRVCDDVGEAVRAAFGEVRVSLKQVDLPMFDAATPTAAAALRPLGFFFSAILPEYLDGDVLRLQRFARTSLVRPELVSPEANAIFDAIDADHTRTLRA